MDARTIPLPYRYEFLAWKSTSMLDVRVTFAVSVIHATTCVITELRFTQTSMM